MKISFNISFIINIIIIIIIITIIMNIADLVTLTGLIVVIYSLFTYYHTDNVIYIYLALIGFTCDYFDGLIARKYNISSEFGNILDKLADKFNQIGILLLLIVKFNLPPIYLLLYIIREIIIYLLRVNNLKSKSSTFYAKLKTFLFPALLILFHYNVSIKIEYIQLLTLFNFITLLI